MISSNRQTFIFVVQFCSEITAFKDNYHPLFCVWWMGLSGWDFTVVMFRDGVKGLHQETSLENLKKHLCENAPWRTAGLFLVWWIETRPADEIFIMMCTRAPHKRLLLRLPTSRPLLRLPTSGPLLRLPTSRPLLRLPTSRPLLWLPISRSLLWLPTSLPLLRRVCVEREWLVVRSNQRYRTRETYSPREQKTRIHETNKQKTIQRFDSKSS